MYLVYLREDKSKQEETPKKIPAKQRKKEDAKKQKEQEAKEKLIKEERLRLHDEAIKKQNVTFITIK